MGLRRLRLGLAMLTYQDWLLFCFVLNLMSSGFPAWKASRIGIVNALGGRLH